MVQRRCLSHPEKGEGKFPEADNGNEEHFMGLEIREGNLVTGEV